VHGAAAETIAIVALVVSIGCAVFRPFGLGEAVVAVPAAAVLVLTGATTWHQALDRIETIGPTVGFLAAILVFGHLCAEADVFAYLGSRAARASRGRPRRLLVLVVGLAAAVTVVLTLDATVVLLTPVVLATVTQLDVARRPPLYACTRLANSGSLLLPVSNLTNLLAFTASGLSFGRFALLMLLPWLLVCAGEWLGLRTFFRADLPAGEHPLPSDVPTAPVYTLAVLALTVVGFVVTSSVHVQPAWAALGGCVLLLLPRARHRDVRALRLLGEANPGFCLFVLALAVIVEAVTANGLGHALRHLVPSTSGFGELVLTALVAAGLANLVNNLPATLALIPLAAANPVLVLAMLLGVNIGPNATYGGSLATLLWRRLLPADDAPRAREFHLLGALTVPVLLVICTAGLWISAKAFGS